MNLVGWVTGIGFLSVGIGASAWFSGYRSWGLWIGFVGFVLLIAAVSIQTQYWIWQKNASAESTISAAVALEQRPWVSLAVELADALSYDSKGLDAGVRWHTAIKYQLINTGKTPATKVSVFRDILPFMISYRSAQQATPVAGTDPDAEIRNVCKAAAIFGSGDVLATGEGRVGIFTFNGNPSRFDAAKNSPGYSGNFLVVLCVTYRSTFNAEIHRTAKAFQLFKRDGSPINLNGEVVPQQTLGLVLNPTSENLTD